MAAIYCLLWPDHIQWQPPTDKTLYRTRPFTKFWVVSIEHLRRVWHADRGRLLLRTPGPVPLGLAYVLLIETNPFPNLLLFYRTMIFEYPSVLSRFCLLVCPKNKNVVDNVEILFLVKFCWIPFSSFKGEARAAILPIGPKNTNLIEDVGILLPVKFRQISFSGYGEKVENV